jgi:hypothetical protein
MIPPVDIAGLNIGSIGFGELPPRHARQFANPLRKQQLVRVHRAHSGNGRSTVHGVVFAFVM